MSVEIIKNEVCNEECHIYTHKSGAKIYVIPKPEFSSASAYFGTQYGSIDTTFKTDDMTDFLTVPEGIAHYLEHKLFENEECDAFERFSKTGAYANAYTSFDSTCYLFNCSSNFEESFRILLDFVQDPYFTEETVAKEQGIIGQEINMYDDDPNWSVLFNLLKAMYHNHPVKIDIAGTVESIAKITPELLYQCYNTFYNLNNMFICVAGNVEPKRVFEICDEMLKDTKPVNITRADVVEPYEIVEKSVVHNLPVAMPLFTIGYKEKCETAEKSLKERMCASFVTKILLGNDSMLYKKLFDDDLINDGFFTECFNGHWHSATLIEGESKDPYKVKEIIDEHINQAKIDGLDKVAFERCKKASLGSLVSAFDEPSGIPRMMIDAAMSNEGVFDSIDIAKSITYEDVMNRFKEMFDIDNSSISVVKNKD